MHRDMTLEAQFGFDNAFRMAEFHDGAHHPMVAFAVRMGARMSKRPEKFVVVKSAEYFEQVDTTIPFWWEREVAYRLTLQSGGSVKLPIKTQIAPKG